MLQVRQAERSDLSRITEIYNYAVRTTTATFDLDEFTVEERQSWFSHHGKRHPVFVAEQDNQVVGYSCLSQFREKSAYDNTAEVSVYIDPSVHRQGIGRILLEQLIDTAGNLGYHTLIAGITSGNDGSVRLHEALGFRHVATFREVGYKFDAWQDVTFYQLML